MAGRALRRDASCIRVLGFGYTYRTVNNYLAAIDRLHELGAAVSFALTPRADDPDARRLSRLRGQSVVYHPIPGVARADLPQEGLRAILDEAIDQFSPTHLLLDCTLNYPSNGVFDAIVDRPDRPIVVGFQQGFYQLWQVYEKRFPCDYFLCYGPMHRAHFSQAKQPWVFDVGLPKLDRLRDVAATDERFLLYIAQDTPRPEVLALALTEFSARVGLPVRIKAHPEHTRFYDRLRDQFEFISADDDVVPWIARSSGVVSAGSTSVLEAIMLGKRVVILPGRPATAYEESQLVAYDYTGESMMHVWESQRRVPTLGRQFLDAAVGGFRHDHSDRVVDALIRSAAKRVPPPSRSVVALGLG